jgi:tetrahydromethanopterin S-methyltransferase subunit E
LEIFIDYETENAIMVYCPKCGTNNKEDTKYCVNCGSPLYENASVKAARGKRDECFGLPHGSAIFGLVFGLIIILWGARELLGWTIDFGPFITIVIGILIVAGAIYGYTSRKS